MRGIPFHCQEWLGSCPMLEWVLCTLSPPGGAGFPSRGGAGGGEGHLPLLGGARVPSATGERWGPIPSSSRHGVLSLCQEGLGSSPLLQGAWGGVRAEMFFLSLESCSEIAHSCQPPLHLVFPEEQTASLKFTALQCVDHFSSKGTCFMQQQQLSHCCCFRAQGSLFRGKLLYNGGMDSCHIGASGCTPLLF